MENDISKIITQTHEFGMLSNKYKYNEEKFYSKGTIPLPFPKTRTYDLKIIEKEEDETTSKKYEHIIKVEPKYGIEEILFAGANLPSIKPQEAKIKILLASIGGMFSFEPKNEFQVRGYLHRSQPMPIEIGYHIHLLDEDRIIEGIKPRWYFDISTKQDHEKWSKDLKQKREEFERSQIKGLSELKNREMNI